MKKPLTNTRTIYLVDDDQEDRELFSEALSQVDKAVQLTEFHNCYKLLEALENLATAKPDIILLDMDLPKLGGLECLKKIKTSNTLKDLKVLMLSTFSHPQYIDEAYTSGASFYYVKPTKFPKLKEVIFHALNENWNDARSKTNFVLKF